MIFPLYSYGMKNKSFSLLVEKPADKIPLKKTVFDFFGMATIFIALPQDLCNIVTGNISTQFWHLDRALNSSNSNNIVYSPCSKQLASWNLLHKQIHIFDLEKNHCTSSLIHGTGINEIKYSPCGEQLIIACNKQGIKCFDIKNKKYSSRFDKTFTAITFSRCGKRFAISHIDNTIYIFDLASKTFIESFYCPNTINSLVYSPDGKQLAAASYDNPIRIFDLESKKFTISLNTTSSIRSLFYSPNGKQLATLPYSGKTVCIFDLESKNLIVSFRRDDIIRSIAYSPNGKRLAIATANEQICFFDLETNNQVESLNARSINGRSIICTITYSPCTEQLAVIFVDGSIRFYTNYHTSMTLAQFLLKRIISLWLRSERPSKSIISPENACETITHKFSSKTDNIHLNKEQLMEIWSSFAPNVQSSFWNNISCYIQKYGRPTF